MNSSIDITVPHEIVNDDYVTIVEWHAEQGAIVKSGQTLVSIETSKMVMDVEAPSDGFLDILQGVSTEVAVGERIGRLLSEQPTAGAASAAPTSDAAAASPADASAASSPDGPVDAKISKKAQALIDQYGIDPAEFAGAGLVREADVIAHLEAKKQREEQAAAAPAPSGAEPESTTSAPKKDYRRGLLADAQASAADRGQSVIVLAWNYFFFNWLLGNLVRWAPRGVIMVLHRWRGVRIGKGCFIDPTAIVETAYPENITLGDDVRVTAGVVIMTHIKAPHYLRETGIVPPVVKPVVLDDHSFIGVNAVVMPGVTVGKASVVTSGSVVLQNVPPYTMVAGNPAKVIKEFPRPADTAPAKTASTESSSPRTSATENQHAGGTG